MTLNGLLKKKITSEKQNIFKTSNIIRFTMVKKKESIVLASKSTAISLEENIIRIC